MKKFNKVLLVMIAALLVLAGCSTKAPEEDGKTKITYMNFSSSGAHEETLDKMIAAFNVENPDIEVEVLTYGFADYFEQLQTRIAGNQAPDVYELNIENFNAYVTKGMVEEMGTDLDLDDVNDRALQAFTVDGKQYGLPTKFSNVVMFYNTDLFDEVGLEYPNKDWTWDEEIEAGLKIKEQGDDYFGTFRPVTTNELYKVIAQNGSAIASEDGSKLQLNTKEAKTALQAMVDLVNDTNIAPTTAQLGGLGDWDLFKSGRLGMLVTGIWAFADFEENAPFNWDITVEPGMTNKATHFFSDAIVVSSKSEVKEASMKFAEFFATSEEAAKIRLDAGWDLPVVEKDDIKAEYISQPVPANREAVYDSLDYLVTPLSMERFSEFSDDLQLYIDKVLADQLTVDEALEQAQVELTDKYFN